ncbi:hypothetical protein ARMSODRAFT_1086961 [Armillaria solidipes]|uniref:Uncharacterized protein n=1 Tax=Armillaria solidipes TaxID=1076256 RepID=A0A2H3BAY4_9AGAR|nr:hypothetical protein ARMSODRAFT_1086961 [Armillaria solidipes]
MGGFLWFLAGATAATICCNGRIQAGDYSANPNGYYERGWVHQSAPINESDERVPEKGQQRFGLEEEQPSLERIQELSKQADEAMSDLSEAILDSLMATIIAAKNKLAERRTQREQEEKRASEANKFPPRYV